MKSHFFKLFGVLFLQTIFVAHSAVLCAHSAIRIYENNIALNEPKEVRAGPHLVNQDSETWSLNKSFSTCTRFKMKIFGRGNSNYVSVISISDWLEKDSYVKGPFDFFMRHPTAMARLGMRDPETKNWLAHKLV